MPTGDPVCRKCGQVAWPGHACTSFIVKGLQIDDVMPAYVVDCVQLGPRERLRTVVTELLERGYTPDEIIGQVSEQLSENVVPNTMEE